MMPPSVSSVNNPSSQGAGAARTSVAGVSSFAGSKLSLDETETKEVYSSSSGRNSSTTGSPSSAITDAARAVLPTRAGKRPSNNSQNTQGSIQLPRLLAGRIMGGSSVVEEDISTLGDAGTLPSATTNEEDASLERPQKSKRSPTHGNKKKKSLGGLRGYDTLDEHAPENQQYKPHNYHHPNAVTDEDLCSHATSTLGMDAPTLASLQSDQDGQGTVASIQNKIVALEYNDNSLLPTNMKHNKKNSKQQIRRQRSNSYYDDDDDSEDETTSGELSTSCQRSQTSDVQSILKKRSSFGSSNDVKVRTPKDKQRKSRNKQHVPVSETSTGRNNSKLLQPPKDDRANSDEASGLSFDHCASDMALLGGVLGRDDLNAGELEGQVGVFLRRGAIFAFGLWLFLLALTVAVAPLESYQYASPQEQIANVALLTLLIGVNMNRLATHLVNFSKGWNFLTSGAMTTAFCIQFIAVATAALLTFLPTPILVDPVMGVRCHLVRWAGWSPMAFLMSFLTEAIDLPLDEETNTRMGWFTGILMAISTLAGGASAFCTHELAWVAVISTSITLFIWLYIRLAQKSWALSNMPKGNTTTEIEKYERARYAVRLMSICATLWTILAGSWLACAIGKRFADPDSFWANEWLVLASENCCEAMSKIGYLSVLLDVHEQLFDEVARTARRLGDLRTYMSAVWDMSSDIVVICSSHQSLVTAAASPSFYDLEHANLPVGTNKDHPKFSEKEKRSTLVMEVDPYIGSYRTFDMDLTQKMNRSEAETIMQTSRNKARMVTPVFNKNLKALSDLVCDACVVAFPEGKHKHVIMKDFYAFDDIDKTRSRRICEATISKLQGKVFLIMIRDVTSKLELQDRIVIDRTGEDILSTHSKSSGSSSTNQTSNRSNAKSSSKAGSSSSSSPVEKRPNRVNSLYSDDEDDVKKRNRSSKNKKVAKKPTTRLKQQQSLRTKLIPPKEMERVLDGSSRSSSHLSFGSVSLPATANTPHYTTNLHIPQHLMAASQKLSKETRSENRRRVTADPPAIHAVNVNAMPASLALQNANFAFRPTIPLDTGYTTAAFQEQVSSTGASHELQSHLTPSAIPSHSIKSTETPNSQTRRQSF